MVTLKEIAQMCGVSLSTVSNILNGKKKVSEATKQRVLEIVKQTGYQPNYFAQGMRKRKTKMIGIITEDLKLFSSSPIIERVMAYCEDNNYRSILINLRLYDRWGNTWFNDESKLQAVLGPAIKELLSIKVDGIIYVAGHSRVVNCFPEDFPIPAVVVYAYSRSPKFTSIVIDDEKGGFDITRYLISMGHRNIGVIAGAADNMHTQKRILGYQRALYEEQIPYNPDWIVYGDWDRPSGYLMAEKLIKGNKDITAIFCMNDDMAAGVYDYMEEHNMQVGEDISIAGYDNMDISGYLKPALTTNEIQLAEIGTKASEILIKRLAEESEKTEIPEVIKVPCRMIIRKSVKMLK
ncbi:MAG: LacI family DNA-binding transcriptional regulator [Bacillota bacterium]